jgi:group II intron reverse transcriptase/maturase
MVPTEKILSILRDRGERRVPLRKLYRVLYEPDLYLSAYGKIYRNAGAMTKGTTRETVDGMSQQKIQGITDLLRQGKYHWTPVRRTEIPKANGKTRPLGIPTWSDKLTQEVLRALLESYYEPRFSDRSHGFRPGRSCHTALTQIKKKWRGTVWFIEGDIKGCFDNIDHDALLNILRRDIHDERVIKLIRGLLKAGYMKDWRRQDTPSGTPQGGIISPLLANIYLNELDQFVENDLIPAYTKGKRRKQSVARRKINAKLRWARERGDSPEKLRPLLAARRKVRDGDPHDPDFRRLHYIRYADDFLLGYTGPRKDAEAIRDRIKAFLSDKLKLTLSEEKTFITHSGDDAAQFLGYEIGTVRLNEHSDGPTGNRNIEGMISLRMPRKPQEKIRQVYTKGGKPASIPHILKDSDLAIVRRYQSVLQGLYNYYCLAANVASRMNPILWTLKSSMLRTLAEKHKASVSQIAAKYRFDLPGQNCTFRVIENRESKKPLIAVFGGISLKSRKTPSGQGEFDYDLAFKLGASPSAEIVQRLIQNTCELCGSRENIDVHHIRKMSDLERPGRKEIPAWKQVMINRVRKTLVVCRKCHGAIHGGRYDGPSLKSPESRVRGNSQARFGGGEVEKC